MKQFEGIVDFLKGNTLFLLYTLMFLALVNGVYVDTGFTYMGSLLLYFSSLLVFYVAFKLVFRRRFNFNWNGDSIKSALDSPFFYTGYLIFIVAVMLVHFINLMEIPVLTAYLSNDYYEIVGIRRQISDRTLKIIAYASSFCIKALMPFGLLLFFIKRRWWLYSILFLLAAFYSFALMQKSFIITTLFPVIVYSLLNKKWFFTIKYLITVLGVIYGLLYITNPQFRKIEIPKEVVQEQKELQEKLKNDREYNEAVTMSKRNSSFAFAIYKRVMLTPGKIVSKWFVHVPKDEPFLYGCGYRFLTPFLGCEYESYSKKLYPHIFVKYAKRGIRGNANAASFMYEYSNFGNIGLVMSGLVLALLLVAVEMVFKGYFGLKLAINIFYILMLSSSALTTILFSGGWGMMILLFLFFKDKLNG